jgi:integrase
MAKNDRGFDERPNDVSDKGAPETKGWKAQLQEIIDGNVHKRVNNKVASNRTMQHNSEVLFVIFKTLHYKLNFPILPRNIAERHVKTLVRYWYEERRAAATMRNELSVLRKFCRWIGKPNLIKTLEEYLPDASPERIKVSATAKVTKSWSANGIDVEKKLEEAFRIDNRFGLVIAMQLAFGLRRREAVRMRPWVSDQRDLGKAALIVYEGAKGGRQRMITIEFEFQTQVLDYVKQQIGKRDCLGWKKTIRGENATLERNIDRYDYYMSQLGISKEHCSVCGHGLRAEYAENCALLEGFTPATLGGTGDEFSPEEMRVRKKRVSERLGHSRVQVTNSYFGSTTAAQKAAAEKAAAEATKAEGIAEPASMDANQTVSVAAHEVGTELKVPAGNKAEPGSSNIDRRESVEPTSEPVGVQVAKASAVTQGSGLLGGYYRNAPSGRKHPDDLETTPAKPGARHAEASTGEVSRVAKDDDRKRQSGSGKRPVVDERQLRLPLKDRLSATFKRGKK